MKKSGKTVILLFWQPFSPLPIRIYLINDGLPCQEHCAEPCEVEKRDRSRCFACFFLQNPEDGACLELRLFPYLVAYRQQTALGRSVETVADPCD